MDGGVDMFTNSLQVYRAVVAVLAKDYLRTPRTDDKAWILEKNVATGFLGMLGSIDCMHWGRKNCPFS
jgi:hypothetical protein